MMNICDKLIEPKRYVAKHANDMLEIRGWKGAYER